MRFSHRSFFWIITIAAFVFPDAVTSLTAGDTLIYLQRDDLHSTLVASYEASESKAKPEPKGRPTRNEEEFWQLVESDFSARGSSVPACRDWLKQDKLSLNTPPSGFTAAAKTHLENTRNTIEYVKQSGTKTAAFENRLEAISRQLTAPAKIASQSFKIYLDLRMLRRETIFSHPSLDFDRILINVNPPTLYSHNGDQHLGRHSRIGKGLAVISDWKSQAPKVSYILRDKLPPGAYRNPNLSYDGKHVLFAFCDHSEKKRNLRRYWIYEVSIDGSFCRQVTGTASDPLKTWDDRATVLIEDNDPCYLPDGDLVFISTRSQTFGRCHGSRYNPAWVLHRCKRDGTGIRQLSYGNENEVEPAVLNDGRIAFTRWEYTDRHEMFFHKLWVTRPDGTVIAHLFGNDMIDPHQFLEVAAIPNSHKIAATAQGHHSFNTGTIVVIDPNISDNGEEAITHITPETPYSETHGWPSPHYSHPYPLSEDLFLASRAMHRVPRQGAVPPPAGRGIVLIDPTGGRELIYEDPEMSSFSPIPIQERVRPPKIARLIAEQPDEKDYATVFLQDAYLTRNDPDGQIRPGMIKALRVNALGVQPRARKQGISGFAANNIPKKVLGTVPVNKDGSAFFKVPARTSLQIQTLDENGMAILTDRSFFYLQPGENRSCIGCHETYGTAPQTSKLAKMAKMTPVEITPPAGPNYTGGMSFMRTVQPVLDRYCISCHGLGTNGSETAISINLVNEGRPGYSSAYRTLAKLGDPTVGNKRNMGGLARNISRPRDYYAYRNKLPHMLLKNHGDCNMDRESYMRIIEWLDVNSPYFGDLFPNKMDWRKLKARSSPEVQAFIASVESRFGKELASQPLGALINRVQTEESRILMAPLAAEAGGWGQISPQWKTRKDPEFKKMAALVNDCIITNQDENTNGWLPTLEQGAGEPWVVQARKDYRSQFKNHEPSTKTSKEPK